MRITLTHWMTGSLAVAALLSLAQADEPAVPAEPKLDRYGRVETDNENREGLEVGDHVFAEWAPPLIDAGYLQDQPPPTQPITPLPMVTQPPAGLTGGLGLGGIADRSALTPERQALAQSSAASVTSGDESGIRSTTDAGDLLGQSTATLGVALQKRSPISSDPRVRGYRYQQINARANGAYWYPARPDLDTALSKIDSSLIQDVVTIKGPFTVRHGPGLTFIDVDQYATPRYNNGYESEGRTFLSYETNGDAWYGRQSIQGGNADWGYRASYGHRTAVDYETGAGFLVASGYKSRDIEFALGVDLSSCSTLEFSYLRLDQTDVELASQVNDLRVLVTDGFTLRYDHAGSAAFDRLYIDSWYNRTRFIGDQSNKNDAAFNLPVSGARLIRVDTDGDIMSTGYSSGVSWGSPDDVELTIGNDFRYLSQEYLIDDADPPGSGDGEPDRGIPKTHTSNPGLFVDTVARVSDRLTFRSGARVDWVSINAENDRPLIADPPIRDVDYQLWGAYISLDYELNDAWTLMAGYGHGQRPPTATDLFSDFSNLSITQLEGGLPVAGSLIGFGGIQMPERAQQIDVGLTGEYANLRTGAHAFYSWIDNMNTYQTVPFILPDAVFLFAANHDATLSGGEAYLEADLTQMISVFGNIAYVEGRDQDFNVPLWGIFPLSSRLGVRLQQPDGRWGVEFSALIVDDQDRVNASNLGSVRELPTPGYTVYDLRSYWRANDVFTIVAGVENLADRFYQTHLDFRRDFSNNTPGGVFQPGRNFYFGVEANY